MPIEGNWLTTKEAATMAGYHLQRFCELHRAGKLVYHRADINYLATIDSLSAIMQDCPRCVKPVTNPNLNYFQP